MKIIYFCIILILSSTTAGTAFAQAKATNKVKTIENTTEAKDETADTTTYWKYGSLMLDSNTSAWIKEAVKSHVQKVPIEVLLPTLFPSEKQEKSIGQEVEEQNKKIEPVAEIKPDVVEIPKEAPAFYLKSILYFGEDNWSIWLNKQKITSENANRGDIAIESVDADSVTFTWKKSSIDLILPNWRENFTEVGDNGTFISEDKNITVDIASSNVTFTLKPNQSLVSKSLTIVEGPAESITINAKADNSGPSAIPGQNSATPNSAVSAFGLPTNNELLEATKNLQNIKNILNQNVEKLH